MAFFEHALLGLDGDDFADVPGEAEGDGFVDLSGFWLTFREAVTDRYLADVFEAAQVPTTPPRAGPAHIAMAAGTESERSQMIRVVISAPSQRI
ncbi:hypothetical protein [Streptomyces antibioticus]|uniref:hypothetical protein n=1 Tax=Streptomyces antibioticus TaxID=1890 RepID=UPI0033A53584